MQEHTHAHVHTIHTDFHSKLQFQYKKDDILSVGQHEWSSQLDNMSEPGQHWVTWSMTGAERQVPPYSTDLRNIIVFLTDVFRVIL